MTKFQCPSERELHADSKTHLTFIPSAIFMGVMTIQNMGSFFLGHPVHTKHIVTYVTYIKSLDQQERENSVCQNHV